MNIVLTGSLGNIGRPLTKILVQSGHTITVISSNTGRQQEIEVLGAKAAKIHPHPDVMPQAYTLPILSIHRYAHTLVSCRRHLSKGIMSMYSFPGG